MTPQERKNLRAIRQRVREQMPELVERLLVISRGHDWAALQATDTLLRFVYPQPIVRRRLLSRGKQRGGR